MKLKSTSSKGQQIWAGLCWIVGDALAAALNAWVAVTVYRNVRPENWIHVGFWTMFLALYFVVPFVMRSGRGFDRMDRFIHTGSQSKYE